MGARSLGRRGRSPLRRVCAGLSLLLAMQALLIAGPAVARDDVTVVAGRPVARAAEYPAIPSGATHRLGQPEGATRVLPDTSADGQRPVPRVVHGSDDRVQLSPTFAAIAYLELYTADESFAGQCTGTFIGPNTLLTAAHCLYDPEGFGGWVGPIRVVPGKDGDWEGNGWEWVYNAWVPDEWFNSGATNTAYDWGLISLDTSELGDYVGWYQIGVLTNPSLQRGDFQPTIIGYPGDKPAGTQWGHWADAFDSFDDFTLAYDIDTFGGQSGSAVFRAADAVIAGIHVRGGEFLNYATRIDQFVLDDLLNGCGQIGCELAWFVEDDPVVDPDLGAIDRTWERTDRAIIDGMATRTWMWGPVSFDVRYEPYDEATGGDVTGVSARIVYYWDKSRMEITYPEGDSSSIWYVSNGLLARELMTGELQLGDNRWDYYDPAQVNVAGDADDPLGPTYATFGSVMDWTVPGPEDAITRVITRNGQILNDPSYSIYGAGLATYVPETNHWVAEPFWNFMTSSGAVYQNGGYVYDSLFLNPYYATGLPMTEAFWAEVKVGGSYRDVLMQCFERRCLTYAPTNDPAWQVEAGNVGQHYYTWRYGAMP